MNMNRKTAIKLAMLSFAWGATVPAQAANWFNGNNTLQPGTTIHAIAANSNKNSYTGNAALTHMAWGMQGTWLSFELKAAADVQVTMSSEATNAPGFTIYRTDGVFTGKGAAGEKNGVAGAVHAFNQVAQAGDPGIVWATDNSVIGSLEGNTTENGIVQTLGYVNGSNRNYVNFYGYEVGSGAHDLSIDNEYENGVFGSINHYAGPNGDTNYANLNLVNLQPGFYTLFLGGTNTDGQDTPIDVKVSATPLSTADCLLNWKENEDPARYPHAGLISKTTGAYYYRYYAENDNYLGISTTDNHLWTMGPDKNLIDLGETAGLMSQAGCQ